MEVRQLRQSSARLSVFAQLLVQAPGGAGGDHVGSEGRRALLVGVHICPWPMLRLVHQLLLPGRRPMRQLSSLLPGSATLLGVQQQGTMSAAAAHAAASAAPPPLPPLAADARLLPCDCCCAGGSRTASPTCLSRMRSRSATATWRSWRRSTRRVGIAAAVVLSCSWRTCCLLCAAACPAAAAAWRVRRHLVPPAAHRVHHVLRSAASAAAGVIFEQISIIYQLPRLFVGSFTLVLPYFPTGTGERGEGREQGNAPCSGRAVSVRRCSRLRPRRGGGGAAGRQRLHPLPACARRR